MLINKTLSNYWGFWLERANRSSSCCQSVFGQNTEAQVGPDEQVSSFLLQHLPSVHECVCEYVNVTIRVSLNTDNFCRFMGF